MLQLVSLYGKYDSGHLERQNLGLIVEPVHPGCCQLLNKHAIKRKFFFFARPLTFRENI